MSSWSMLKTTEADDEFDALIGLSKEKKRRMHLWPIARFLKLIEDQLLQTICFR